MYAYLTPITYNLHFTQAIYTYIQHWQQANSVVFYTYLTLRLNTDKKIVTSLAFKADKKQETITI